MNFITRFQLPLAIDRAAFLDKLGEHFGLTTEDEQSEVRTYTDCFDWRLYKSGFACYATSKKCVLEDLESGEVTTSFSCRKPPRFKEELPEEGAWPAVADAMEMRALLPLVTLRVNHAEYAVRNEDRKAVVRMAVREEYPEGEAAAARCSVYLKPMRGYESEFAALSGYLQTEGLTPKENAGHKKMFRRMGYDPGTYSSKVNVKLSPEMRTDEAARVIFKQLIGVMRVNMDGLRQDLDTEFLHDFRVSVRRTRSALSQIKGIFDDSFTRKAKDDFGYVGRLTNFMRDADVYLLARDAYLSMVPEHRRKGVDAFFQHLRRRRVTERKRMLAEMDSERFNKVLDDWEAFLDSPLPEKPAGPDGGRPVLAQASKFIRKRYRQVIQDGLAIDDATPDEELHELRIDCKKLRYLLEFFISLYPTDKMKLLIGNLKKLQENLGDFNDLCVQAETLQHYLDKIPAGRVGRGEVHISIGFLMGVLYSRQLEVRRQFHEKFTQFAGEENRLLFAELFGAKKTGGSH
ncbi:MAG: CHAD domain-containing protein [Acidobacteriota bacterium]|nr:CHAD domain-containing protein [Acidobacteriota bacterium]